MNTSSTGLPHLGIDISKLHFDVCLYLTDQSLRRADFTNDAKGFLELDTWLRSLGVTQSVAGLEATGPYGVALLWHLHRQGHVVHLLNARRVKDFGRSQGRRVKTDRSDAALVGAYLKGSEGLHPWNPPAQALLDLQSLVRRRAQLITMLQAEHNRKEGSVAKLVADSLRRQIQCLKAEVAQIERAIQELLLQHSALQQTQRLLTSIDGVGPIVAATILAEVPAISAFARARDVAAFAGLTPALRQSGTSVRRRGRMTKEGSALLRKMLYMAALQATKRSANAFHQHYKALLERGKSKMCAIGAIMHKLMRVAFGVLKHQTPFVPNFAKI